MGKSIKNEDELLEDEIIEDIIDEDIDKNISKKKDTKKKNKGLIIILVVTILFLLIGGFLFVKISTPSIQRNGTKEVLLTINSEYYDLGAKAKVNGKDKTAKIKTTGKVDTSKEGIYKITYEIKNLLFVKKTFRVVSVLKDGPVITLEGDKDYSICPNATYEEVGYKATNSKEEDLIEKVKSKVSKDLVTYIVEDNSVSYTTSRKLIREDKEAPELKLNGNDHVYVTLGAKYNEQGASANDKCDGDLTEKVEISGTVDTNTLGDYEITYKVSDNASNEASITRKVTVQKEVIKRSASLGCGQAGVIYLTFDDGPNSTYTPKILEVLKKYNVKATFFVTNNGPSELIKREFDEGHKIALHTASHDYAKVYASDQAYWNDLNTVNATVEKVTGKKSYLVRFPGGSSNTVSRHYSSGIMSRLANDLESKGYSYFDWNVDSRDAEGKDCNSVYSYATGGLSKSSGNVILMHDIKPATACAIERIVKYGLDNGYTFKVLDSSVVCHHKTAN